MANGFGSLYVGSSGLRGAQNALNVVANNLSNIDTKGYVREQVIFEDRSYVYFADAAVSQQRTGLGVNIGDVIHTRDRFLDRAYRSEAGRHAFYDAGYEAATEVETLLQEGQGEAFSLAIKDLYEAFNEFAKDPSRAEVQNLVAQKSSLYLARGQAVYAGMTSYQTNINRKIKDDVDKINELAKTIDKMNVAIQRVEAGNVETAMQQRDVRDQAIDELSKLANISYDETYDGIVRVQIEGQPLVDKDRVYEISIYRDNATGYVTPYWGNLSDASRGGIYPVFNTDYTSSEGNMDIGEVKALLLARGDKNAIYTDMAGQTSAQYEQGISRSVMMNSEAELDYMYHEMVTAINDILSPKKELQLSDFKTDDLVDKDGKKQLYLRNISTGEAGYYMDGQIELLDEENCCVGSDGELPPHELFSRQTVERFSKCELLDADGNGTGKYVYMYNAEDPKDRSTLYTITNTKINQEVAEQPSLLPHVHQKDRETGKGGAIAYDMAENLYNVWETEGYHLNPSDETPCSFENFYAKLCGELANEGSVFKTMSESLKATRDQVESRRQEVLGVNSDEELQSMIKYQNAYNASSRYITVVSQMIEHLLSMA